MGILVGPLNIILKHVLSKLYNPHKHGIEENIQNEEMPHLLCIGTMRYHHKHTWGSDVLKLAYFVLESKLTRAD